MFPATGLLHVGKFAYFPLSISILQFRQLLSQLETTSRQHSQRNIGSIQLSTKWRKRISSISILGCNMLQQKSICPIIKKKKKKIGRENNKKIPTV